MTPVYPKENPEYRQKVLERFYKTVRETNWGADEDRVSKPRGRKPKPSIRYESQPRTPFEREALKQSKYNWL
jgi:hypothetical protein